MLKKAEFVGRTRELELLTRACDSPQSGLIPLYGRRRVGKSELILRLLQGRPGGLYFLGKKAPAALQVEEFLSEAARVLEEPLIAEQGTRSWKEALLSVTSRWRGPGKLILAWDEFQWSAAASPELPSVLQDCWDRHWRDAGNVLVLLCGSLLGFMQREVLGSESPLFGRRTAQLLVRPFGHREAGLFHPDWSLADRARLYFTVGGIPQYLRAFDANKSYEQNLQEQLFDEFAPLHREPDFLLREELRDVESYHGVLLAIAAGAGSVQDIARTASLSARSLPYYLQQLTELGYVARRHPLDGNPRRNARQVRYVLDDPLLRFWFRFVFPNLSYMSSGGPARVFRERVRPELDAHHGLGFERLCREALPSLYRRENVDASFEVGEYWDAKVQLDVVSVRDDGWTDLGECRWGRIRSSKSLAEELEERVQLYPNRPGHTLGRRYFVQRKPSGRLAGAGRWHDLEELYSVDE
ncbi:MAG: ATP-binding protein [Acidobacteriota bacterium]